MSRVLLLLLMVGPVLGQSSRVLVSFRGAQGVPLARWREAARAAQAGVLEELARAGARAGAPRSLWIAHAMAVTVDTRARRLLECDSRVESVEADEVLRLEDDRPAPSSTTVTDVTYGLEKLRIPAVRAAHGLTGSGVRVGIIDSGIDAAHPDLAGKVASFHDLVGARAAPYDDNGHGTHCAGTIAGGEGYAVAPGARLVVVKAFDGAGATTRERLLAAMQVIADPDGDPATGDHPSIASNSWHGSGGRKFFLTATRRWVELGILPVFATGNDGPGVSTTWIPAGYLEAIAVGATDERDRIADFSSRGPIFWDGDPHVKPDLCAPGEAVLSARAGGGLVAMSGTSMATPHVAGVLALLEEVRPAATPAARRAALEATVLDLGEAGRDNTFGHGRVDALAAVARILQP